MRQIASRLKAFQSFALWVLRGDDPRWVKAVNPLPGAGLSVSALRETIPCLHRGTLAEVTGRVGVGNETVLRVQGNYGSEVDGATLEAGRCLCLFEWEKFGCRNEKFREATVQADQNTLANVDRRNLQVLRTGETDCQFPIQILHVRGIANFTSHCHTKPMVAISTFSIARYVGF
jgi:hypothetical protein